MFPHLTRTKPHITDLDDETLQQNPNPNPINTNEHDEETQLLCCSCHRPLEPIGAPNSILCCICNKFPSAYLCAPCPLGLINFFDRRCAELPKQIHYPYHPHRLALRIRKKCACDVCHGSCRAFNYGCDGCCFTVDVKCALKEIKKYEGPLTSVRKFIPLIPDL